jgi:hypothetical protein
MDRPLWKTTSMTRNPVLALERFLWGVHWLQQLAVARFSARLNPDNYHGSVSIESLHMLVQPFGNRTPSSSSSSSRTPFSTDYFLFSASHSIIASHVLFTIFGEHHTYSGHCFTVFCPAYFLFYILYMCLIYFHWFSSLVVYCILRLAVVGKESYWLAGSDCYAGSC